MTSMKPSAAQLVVRDGNRGSRNAELIRQFAGGRQLTAPFIDPGQDLVAKSFVDLARAQVLRATCRRGTGLMDQRRIGNYVPLIPLLAFVRKKAPLTKFFNPPMLNPETGGVS
ncbi:hypothetical protein A9K71_12980 [Mesorhizobium sp. WSM3873]|nr:hypothetical protein A9K71_12980 [Mesorhizobium sp. WSM3873]